MVARYRGASVALAGPRSPRSGLGHYLGCKLFIWRNASNTSAVYAVRLSFLKDGTLPDGSPLPEGVQPFKLDAKALEDRYGKHKESTVMQQLRKLDIYRREGGMDPDAAAELFGYSSGDEMIQALLKTRPIDAGPDSGRDREKGTR